jgi:uncharacterized protein (DUF779 family)
MTNKVVGASQAHKLLAEIAADHGPLLFPQSDRAGSATPPGAVNDRALRRRA